MAQFDEKSSLYGVYDGHGVSSVPVGIYKILPLHYRLKLRFNCTPQGAEVAMYVAQHFPDLLKSTAAYLDGDIEKAFIEAYLKMDANIKEPEVLKEIRRLAKLADGDDSVDATADYEEENVSELYEEATMPLDKLVAKYQTGVPISDGGPSKESTTEEKPCSSTSAGGSGRSSRLFLTSPSKTDNSSSVTNQETILLSSSNGVINGSDIKNEKESSSASKSPVPESNSNNVEEKAVVDENNETSKSLHCNGNGVKVEPSNADATDSKIAEVTKEEAVEPVVSPKKKGKVHPVPIVATGIDVTNKPPKRDSSKKATLAGLMAFSHEDDSSDFDSSDSDAVPPGSCSSDGSSEDDDDDSSAAGEGDSDEDSEEAEDDSFLNVSSYHFTFQKGRVCELNLRYNWVPVLKENYMSYFVNRECKNLGLIRVPLLWFLSSDGKMTN